MLKLVPGQRKARIGDSSVVAEVHVRAAPGLRLRVPVATEVREAGMPPLVEVPAGAALAAEGPLSRRDNSRAVPVSQ
ncbi:hypothetical protein [Dactylosporangium sp. NPDC049140]|uniref:hypothetical protein n=1 Tax=Dactylosporangium sp. NPDC049140 TaxID=3155647 RepID=UPI00340B2E39